MTVHPIYQIVSFEIVAPYTLQVRFDDGSEQWINFDAVLAGEVHGPLRRLSLFNQVRLDPETRTLIWPNGADFDPATLHDWPMVAPELAGRAARWHRAALPMHSVTPREAHNKVLHLHEEGVDYELSEEADFHQETDKEAAL